jgi:hypothetical protein
MANFASIRSWLWIQRLFHVTVARRERVTPWIQIRWLVVGGGERGAAPFLINSGQQIIVSSGGNVSN